MHFGAKETGYLEYFRSVALVVVGSAFKRDNLSLPLVPIDLDEHCGIGASKCHISSHDCYLIVNDWKNEGCHQFRMNLVCVCVSVCIQYIVFSSDVRL